MSTKEIKLTNWQVPRSAKGQEIDALKQAPSFDQKNYENVAGIDHCADTQAVVEKLMQKREAATGISINAPPESAPKVNLNGINDERTTKEFWQPPRIGKR